MIAILTALTLFAAGDGATPDRLENGRYAALGADGAPVCDDESVDHFDLYALASSPHYRSRNLGNFDFRIEDSADGYILQSGPVLGPPDADGHRRTTIEGGQVHTVGREVQGVLSSQTIGHFYAVLSIDAEGRVWIEAMSFDAARWRREEIVYVAEGDPAGPFGFCGA
jgi:hypothetical protein